MKIYRQRELVKGWNSTISDGHPFIFFWREGFKKGLYIIKNLKIEAWNLYTYKISIINIIYVQ